MTDIDQKALEAALVAANDAANDDDTDHKAIMEAAILAYLANAPISEAQRDVIAERRRQVEVEGWHHDHDDATHDAGGLAIAAACYAIGSAEITGHNKARVLIWPWDWKWWKPKDRRRNLVKAGALILAEIERLDRLTAARKAGMGEG